MADSYFKKPEFKDRTTPGYVEEVVVRSEHETFLVYESDGRVLGSVHVSWSPSDRKGQFGMLSVSGDAQKRGIGGALVSAVQKYCWDQLQKSSSGSVTITMPVIHSRTDLIPFYEKRGFAHCDTKPFVAPEIVQDGVLVEMLIFEKSVNFE